MVKVNGSYRYYDENLGDLIRSAWCQVGDNQWFYLNASGEAVTGKQTINEQELFFDQSGIQVKGSTAKDKSNVLRFYDNDNGTIKSTGWYLAHNNQWVYVNAKKEAVTGAQTINGQHLFFNESGYQIKGSSVTVSNGVIHYYDKNSGDMVRNSWQQVTNGEWS